MQNDDRGQVAPLMLMILGVALVAILLVADRGHQADDVARAQTAADAAALAGATYGDSAARSMAEANGAQLESFVLDRTRVSVEVSVGSAFAMATAERIWEWVTPP